MGYLKSIIVIPSAYLKPDKLGFLSHLLTKENISLSTSDNTSLFQAPASSGALFLTDSAEACRQLLEAGQAVLIFLHPENSSESFSGAKYACENLTDLTPDYLERVYRRYRGIPWDILTTPRLLLRETTPEDVDAFLSIYSDPAITRYTEALYPREEEIAYTRDYIRNMYEFYGFGIWTVIERSTGVIIGRAGLTMREGYEDPELGYVIGTPWQNKGYATEALRAILTYAKEELGLDTLRALVKPDNKKSRHLLEKLGFSESLSYNSQNQEYIHYCGRNL
ncbi:MAG: GNAT family N-acetyltransferase [Acetatifactor sp.]